MANNDSEREVVFTADVSGWNPVATGSNGVVVELLGFERTQDVSFSYIDDKKRFAFYALAPMSMRNEELNWNVMRIGNFAVVGRTRLDRVELDADELTEVKTNIKLALATIPVRPDRAPEEKRTFDRVDFV